MGFAVDFYDDGAVVAFGDVDLVVAVCAQSEADFIGVVHGGDQTLRIFAHDGGAVILVGGYGVFAVVDVRQIDDGVVSCSAVYNIFAFASDDKVFAVAAFNGVFAFAAVNGVVADAAFQRVIALAAIQVVFALTA